MNMQVAKVIISKDDIAIDSVDMDNLISTGDLYTLHEFINNQLEMGRDIIITNKPERYII